MALKVYNTLTRTTELFEPLEPGKVKMYTCGPTVYDFAHIGNFRAYIFEDLLRRHLEFSGYAVTQVMNLTDVDDKTIKGAAVAGKSLADYTRTYKEAFFKDIAWLNIRRAERYPEATAHIPEMIALISKLLDKGVAYRSGDGSIYFSIRKFPGYGKLARLDMSGLKPGARIAQDEYQKENAADFALWKAWDEADGEVWWDSPWGRGRPGWHIECSAMSMKYLGESFDLHTGGIDNIFPHHEDEIAQSEAATARQFVKYWMHCAHLVVEGRKMSKSLGNFFTLRDVAARGYNGRVTRYVLANAHYRQTLDFSFAALDAARAALARLDDFRRRLEAAAAGETGGSRKTAPAWVAEAAANFRNAMDEDLNTPAALAAIFEMARAGNKEMDAGRLKPAEAAAALAELDRMDEVFGFLRPETPQCPDAKALELLQARSAARAARNWAAADRLRKELEALGWTVKDTAWGSELVRKTEGQACAGNS